MLPGLAARIGYPVEDFGQGLELRGGDGQRRALATGLPGGMHGIKDRGAQPRLGIGTQRFDPELLRPVVGHIKLRPLPAVALREAQRDPTGRLIASSCMAFDIGERLLRCRSPLRGSLSAGYLPAVGSHSNGS